MWVFSALVFILFLLLAYFVNEAHEQENYFKSRGVFYLGYGVKNMLVSLFITRHGIIQMFILQYEKMKKAGVSYAGTKDIGINTYVIKDPLLIKHILVKDFDHFVNRRISFLTDKFLQNMLVFLEDEKWKAMRSKLSPTFTTGKIKRMFALFNQSAKKLVSYTEKKMSENGELDLVEGYSKFTMDVIASAVCGIDSQAFLQDEASLFEKMGRKLQIKFSPRMMLRFTLIIQVPRLAEFLGVTLFGKEVEGFFSTIIKNSIRHRQKTGEKRDDFLQLMLEAREGQLKLEEGELEGFERDAMIKNNPDWKPTSELLDDDGIVANCVIFMLAGYDTTQSFLLFTAYALAINQEVQEKLREEIDKRLDDNGGEFTYDVVQKIVYLDMVINETLRFYPPAPITERGCTQDYKLPGTEVTLKKGEGVNIPIFALHHDEDFFSQPEEFDPQRFSPENKANINPYAYMPFGQGPRNCIGMRFALIEVKLAIAHLVHNFKIEPSAKTMIPMEYDSASVLKPKGGKMYLALNKRHLN